jgi:hypothetical protein
MKGFYKIPVSSVGQFLYGDMTGHRIDLVGTIGGDSFYFVSDDDCPIPEPVKENGAEFIFVNLTAEQAAILKPQAAGDIRAELFPEIDLKKFNQLFSLAVLEGTFTGEQYLISQIAQNVENEAVRNGWLSDLIRAGSPEQQAVLIGIARACEVPLPSL